MDCSYDFGFLLFTFYFYFLLFNDIFGYGLFVLSQPWFVTGVANGNGLFFLFFDCFDGGPRIFAAVSTADVAVHRSVQRSFL